MSKPKNVQKIKLCLIVNRNKSDSLPSKPTSAHAIAIDCGEIILPVTPPIALAATVNSGAMFNWVAVFACNEPNKAFADVSDPVKKTPNQPKNGEKNGKVTLVAANTNAKVEDNPE